MIQFTMIFVAIIVANIVLSRLLALLDTHIPVKISKWRQHHPRTTLELPHTQIQILLRPQEVIRLF